MSPASSRPTRRSPCSSTRSYLSGSSCAPGGLLFGLNIGPFNGLSFVVGGHFGRVTALDGAKVGDVLASDVAIPTRREWPTAVFLGASIDISVATKLFFAMEVIFLELQN